MHRESISITGLIPAENGIKALSNERAFCHACWRCRIDSSGSCGVDGYPWPVTTNI